MHPPHAPSHLDVVRVLDVLHEAADALQQVTPFHRLDVVSLVWEQGQDARVDVADNPMADDSAHALLQRLHSLQPILASWAWMAESLLATPTIGPLMASADVPSLRLERRANGFALHLGTFGMRSGSPPCHPRVDAISNPLMEALSLAPEAPRDLRFSESTTGGVVGAGTVPPNVVEALWPAFTRPAWTGSSGERYAYPMVVWERCTLPVDAYTADLCECPLPMGHAGKPPSPHDGTLRLGLRRDSPKGDLSRTVLAQLLALQQVAWGTQFCWIPAPGTDTSRLLVL